MLRVTLYCPPQGMELETERGPPCVAQRKQRNTARVLRGTNNLDRVVSLAQRKQDSSVQRWHLSPAARVAIAPL
jgi:hypothetical protein